MAKKLSSKTSGKPKGKSWREALELLEKGNKRFRKLKGPGADRGPRSFNRCERTESSEPAWPWNEDCQFPWAVIVTCADSRVTPEAIFDTGVGELFVIRVAGNIANVETVASVEYAVNALDPAPRLVVVLGHEKCGAVKAALEGKHLGYNLNALLAPIKLATTRARSLTGAVKDNAENTVKELEYLVRDIPERTAPLKGIKILPAYYHLESGKVEYLSDD